MAAICVHTPLDRARGGINDRLHQLLQEPLQLSGAMQTPEADCNGIGFGWADQSNIDWNAKDLAETLRRVLGCTVVRYAPIDRPIRKIYVGCGACASMLEDAAAWGCDAMITGMSSTIAGMLLKIWGLHCLTVGIIIQNRLLLRF